MSSGYAEYADTRKRTCSEVCLEEMDQVVSWRLLLALIEPCYPIAGRDRHTQPLEVMLRVP
jgi:transposase, IS5 family